LYNDIHNLHEAGYSLRKIEKELHCSRRTIKTYLNGDINSVCVNQHRSCVELFHDEVVKSLSDGICRSELYKSLQSKGLTCGRTAAYEYFNRVAKQYHIELTPLEGCTPKQKQLRKDIKKYVCISRKKIFDYLWMDKNPELEDKHFEYLIREYPVIMKLKICIREFRDTFEKERIPLLYCFIENYKCSDLKLLSAFAKGLEKDLEAIENAVSMPLSNGFVEGTNNKIKMIKRTMYGRCGCKLLAAKLMVKI